MNEVTGASSPEATTGLSSLRDEAVPSSPSVSIPCGETLLAVRNERPEGAGQWSIGIQNKYGHHGVGDFGIDRYLLVSGYCYEEDALKMAAAREMFAALKALHHQALQSNVNDPANEWGREALDMARAALAKATGNV